MTNEMIQGSLALGGAALAVQWKLTGVSPVKQVSRTVDLVRAAGFLAGRMWAEVKDVRRRDWESCVSRARRER